MNSLQIPAVGSGQPVPTSPTGPPPPFPPPSSSSTPATPTPLLIRPSHNDLNDANNISKILQSSFQNGSGSTITNTNHNNNHSNEKRLFVDEQFSISLTKINQKKDISKAGDEKQHHRGKRKPRPANLTVPQTTIVVALKQNQHKHTNGLNSGSEKLLNNRHSVLNGDDAYEEEQMDKWKQENMETRSVAFKEVRKPGRDYKGLFEQLEKVKGTFEMRFGFTQMCIDEAFRFRRKHMANCIQEWWDEKCLESVGKVKA